MKDIFGYNKLPSNVEFWNGKSSEGAPIYMNANMADAGDWEVFLDGCRVHGCYAADRAMGFVVCTRSSILVSGSVRSAWVVGGKIQLDTYTGTVVLVAKAHVEPPPVDATVGLEEVMKAPGMLAVLAERCMDDKSEEFKNAFVEEVIVVPPDKMPG